MTRFIPVTWFTLAMVAMVARHCQAEDPQEQKVRELANKYVAMVRTDNPTSLDAIGQMLDKDFIQSTSHGTVVRGREENLRWNKEAVDQIKNLFSQFDFRFDIQSVRVNVDTALVFGKLTLFGQLEDGGKFERQIWETIVFEKTDAQWKMVHEHSTRVKAE
jgi:ketosteroid isomerase-like protein